MCWICNSPQAFVAEETTPQAQATSPSGISLATGIASVMTTNYWGTPVITYSIATAGAAWSDYAAGTAYSEAFKAQYATLSAQQAAQFRLAIAEWDELIATSFVETSGLANTGDIRVAFTDVGSAAAYAYYPNANGMASSFDVNGDVWISNRSIGSTLAPGTYDFMVLLHELGHALGLKHTFEGTSTLTGADDTYRSSIMSYTDIKDVYSVTFSGSGGGISASYGTGDVRFITPSMYDIAAVQQRYGADLNTRSGATTYTWNPAAKTIEVVYDAGGIDTFDLSAQTRASNVDLRDGSYSSINMFTQADQIAQAVATYGEGYRAFIESVFASIPAGGLFEGRNNVGIAFGTVIENVRFGSANDTGLGNGADNLMTGGGGNDSLSGADGNDDLQGDGGNDTLLGDNGNDRLAGGAGADLVNGGGGFDVIDYSGDAAAGGSFGIYVSLAAGVALDGFGTVDTLLNIENIYGTAGTYNGLPTWSDFLIGGAGNEAFYGLGGNDYLDMGAGADTGLGGDGNDYLFGRDGNDTLGGEAGTDYITGDNGADSLSGGDGNDYLFGGAGNDTILGDAGSDLIIAGAGSDSVVGGAGQDYFYNVATADYVAGDYDTFADLAADDYIFMPLSLQGATSFAATAAGTLITTTVAGGTWTGLVTAQSVAFTQGHVIFA